MTEDDAKKWVMAGDGMGKASPSKPDDKDKYVYACGCR